MTRSKPGKEYSKHEMVFMKPLSEERAEYV